jgi:hypothetical protein
MAGNSPGENNENGADDLLSNMLKGMMTAEQMKMYEMFSDEGHEEEEDNKENEHTIIDDG